MSEHFGEPDIKITTEGVDGHLGAHLVGLGGAAEREHGAPVLGGEGVA